MNAILEFEMPNSCSKCPISYTKIRRFGDGEELMVRYCAFTCTFTKRECADRLNGIEEYTEIRAPFCPLKTVANIAN